MSPLPPRCVAYEQRFNTVAMTNFLLVKTAAHSVQKAIRKKGEINVRGWIRLISAKKEARLRKFWGGRCKHVVVFFFFSEYVVPEAATSSGEITF